MKNDFPGVGRESRSISRTRNLIAPCLFLWMLVSAAILGCNILGCSASGGNSSGEEDDGGAQADPDGAVSGTPADSRFVPQEFAIFWPHPTRAYPGLPLQFRLSAFDSQNNNFAWSLSKAPNGMQITSSGVVSWSTPATSSGKSDVSVKAARPDGSAATANFNIRTDATDFLFVSPAGSDGNPGTLERPFKTIERALRAVPDGNGKTIYLRGGTYHEHYVWEENGVYSPFNGKQFTADDPVEISSYPGESAILDCDYQGHGLWAYNTAYVIFRNLEVRHASHYERGGLMAERSHHIAILDSVVSGSRWSYTENPAGIYVNGRDIIVDGVTAFDNRDPASDSWNSSNFIVYNSDVDGTGPGTNYILNSVSSQSVVGFKVKHAGSRNLVIHRCTSDGDTIGFAVGSDYSSVRFSTATNNSIGILNGIADPNAFTGGPRLFEFNRVIGSKESAIEVQSTHYSVSSPTIIRNNQLFSSLISTPLLILWQYDADTAGRALNISGNSFSSRNSGALVKIGSSVFSFDEVHEGIDKGATFTPQ